MPLAARGTVILVASAATSRPKPPHDPDLVAWWLTEVECVSALTQRERDGVVTDAAMAQALARLAALSSDWREVQPVVRVRRTAVRLLRVHPRLAADALQLAAALAAADDQPDSLPFVTLDGQLAGAAAREGFAVMRPQV